MSIVGHKASILLASMPITGDEYGEKFAIKIERPLGIGRRNTLIEHRPKCVHERCPIPIRA